MAASTVVDGCVNSLDRQKWYITEKGKPFIYRVFRVSDRMSKKIEQQFTTATTRMVDGCVDILKVCIQVDITNNKKVGCLNPIFRRRVWNKDLN